MEEETATTQDTVSLTAPSESHSQTSRNAEDVSTKSINLVTLDKDFQATMQQLSASSDRQFARFRTEHERMHDALMKSVESEQRLVEKVTRLGEEVTQHRERVQMAVKTTDEDQATIATMKKEIDRAWKMVDAAHRKEQSSKETIKALRLEISNLGTLMMQGMGTTVGTETSVQDLIQTREDLLKEKESHLSELSRVKADLVKLEQSNTDLTQQRDDALAKAAELNQDVQLKQSEAQREQRRKEKVERELGSLKSQLESSAVKVVEVAESKAQVEAQVAALRERLKEEEKASEKLSKEVEVLTSRNAKLHGDYEAAMVNEGQLSAEIDQKVADLKMKENDIQQGRLDLLKMTKQRDDLHRKVNVHEVQKKKIEDELDIVKGQVHNLQRDLDSSKKNTVQDKKMMEELLREKEMLKKNIAKLNSSFQQQLLTSKYREDTRKAEEKQLHKVTAEYDTLEKRLRAMEKERDKYILEATKASDMLVSQISETKSKELKIQDVEKKLADADTRLKEQQNMYETARADRNACSKNLVEAMDEIAEHERKHKILSNQIEQLKEEVSVKETALVKENGELQKVEKEKEIMKTKLHASRDEIKGIKFQIEQQEKEKRKLEKSIIVADGKIARLERNLRELVTERNSINTKLVHRNDELSLVQQELRVRQSALEAGEAKYRERVEEMTLLTREISELRREREVLAKEAGKSEELRREVLSLNKDLNVAKTRVTALEQDVQTPMNIHRWRKLEVCFSC